MKTVRLASVAAAALSGALFATSVTADLPPIVIKVGTALLPSICLRRMLTLLGVSFLLRERYRVLHSRCRLSTGRQLQRNYLWHLDILGSSRRCKWM